MKKLLIITLLALTIIKPTFAGLVKERVLHGQTFKYHRLRSANFDRINKVVRIKYDIYASKAFYDLEPHNKIKTIAVVVPFSAFPAQNLLNVLTLCQSATKRSIKNEFDIETNWFADSVEVTD